MPNSASSPAGRGSALEVFAAFLRLGLTSFGGPIAHLGYFRAEFVERRRWLDDQAFAELVALCQFLPGPASSQVGFAIGLIRGGPLGGLAAWTAFTAPSALLMVLFAYGVGGAPRPWEAGAIHGLKLAAVAVIAQAVWGMARALAPDARRAVLAVAALAAVTIIGGGVGQLVALAIGAGVGLVLLSQPGEAARTQAGPAALRLPVSASVGWAGLGLFATLLLIPPLVLGLVHSRTIDVADAFYQSGAMVFGGGHVVLPLLQAKIVQPGWADQAPFLSGYALAQALPGPLFAFAAYLGALLRPGPNGLAGAAIATLAIFLPGLLLLLGVAPFWNGLRDSPGAQGAIRGANAAVVGILGAALYYPVWVSAVVTPIDFAVAAAGFVALASLRAPPLAIIAGCASAGAILGAFPA